MSTKKKGIKILIFVLILFMSMNNIKAIGTDMENDLKYIPNMEVEKLIEDHNIILPTKPTRAASGSVVEKIIKNSNGIMTGKEFRVDGKLVEAVYYNYLGNNAYQLCKRNLYHSDGKTIERTRLYNKSEWITNTKRYTEKGIIDWTTDYDGTSNKYPTVSSKYEETGKFWIYTNYYNKGILSSKDYRPGLAPNHISHTGFYEVTGTNWTKAQYYYTNANPTDKSKIDLVILYLGHASPNNFKTYETKYRNDGTRDYYIRYEEKNNNRDYLTYYNTAGKVIKTVSYYKGNSNREWETIYNDKDTKASAKKYSNTSGKLIDDVVFQDNGIVDHRTYYNDEGIKTRTLSHYKNSNSVEWETFYKEDGFKEKANRYSNGTNKLIDEIVYQEQNKVDVRTYFSEEGKKILVVRYKINGIDMKWITKYKNGEKIAYAYPSEKKFDIDRIKNSDISTLNVKQIDIDENLSDNTFYYYSKEELNNDLLIDELKNEKKDTTIYSLFEDSTLSDYISQLTELDASREIFGEDLMKIKKININIHDDESFSFLENINGINLLINIEEITINNTNLEKISGNISLLPKLRILNLSNNKIDDIGENLSNLRKLEYIDLSNNLIIGIHDEFDNLINLNYLGLNNMDIKFLSNSLIDMHDHYSLKKIDLTENIVSLEYMDLIRINDFIDNNILFDGEKPFKKLFDNREIFIFNDDKDFNSMIDLTLLTKFFDSKKDIKYNLNLKLYYINDSLNDDININNITSFKDELINSDAISNEFTINDNLLSNKGTYIVLLEISTDKYKAVSSRIIRKYDITSTVYYSTLINDNSDEYNVKDNNLNFKIVGESDNNVKNKGEIEFDCRRNYVYKGIKKRNAKAEKIHPSFPVPIKTNRFWVYSSKQISVSGAIGVGYKFVNASFTISGGSGGGAWEISSNKNKKARPVVVTYGNLQAYAHRYGHCPMKYVLTHGWETGYAKYYK